MNNDEYKRSFKILILYFNKTKITLVGLLFINFAKG